MSELGVVLWWWYFKFCKNETKLILSLQNHWPFYQHKNKQKPASCSYLWEGLRVSSLYFNYSYCFFISFTLGSHSRLVSVERIGLTTRNGALWLDGGLQGCWGPPAAALPPALSAQVTVPRSHESHRYWHLAPCHVADEWEQFCSSLISELWMRRKQGTGQSLWELCCKGERIGPGN